jgi:hypothetical protein
MVTRMRPGADRALKDGRRRGLYTDCAAASNQCPTAESFRLHRANIVGQARNEFIRVLLRLVRAKLEAPYRHVPRPVGRQGRAAVDDPAYLVVRKRSAVTARNSCQVGHHTRQARRDRPVTVTLITVATRTKPRVELSPGVVRKIRWIRGRLCATHHRSDQQQDQGDDERNCNVSCMRFHMYP